MALDREALRKPVRDAREALTQDIVAVLEGTYGIHKNGTFEDVSRLPALVDARARETRDLLELVLPPPPVTKAERDRFEEAFDAKVRSLAFTHLNRLVAFKMMEHPSRKVLPREAVGKGLKSRGFIFYLADHPEDEALFGGAQQDRAYRNYLLWLAGQFHQEIGVLFDPDDLASRIFPAKALPVVLDLINAEALAPAWEHEEALGWVYQFYTPEGLRGETRRKKPAPRSSHELAVRNQFYTPDYVVRFLTDNALGRLWLEMKVDTALRERCECLVVGPDETLVPRAKKDPREIRVLDPACGSGHFLLYSFELFEIIYREAYADAELGPALARDFPDRAVFEAQIPALIIEHNLHGIDIDKRATQIASLVLFLKAKSRNKVVRIERGNIVCAEPMPGNRALFEDFKQRKLGNAAGVRARILDGIWGHLELAGEAGSLLKAESEIERLVAEEHQKWREYERKKRGQSLLFPEMRPPEQQELDFQDVDDAGFWSKTEAEIEGLLRDYAEEAAGAEAAHRRMFAKDGVEGFRFVDLLGRRYDVALMNPPFGEPSIGANDYINDTYPQAKNDIYAAMVQRGMMCVSRERGYVGAITSRAFAVGRDLRLFRRLILDSEALSCLRLFLDLGKEVLDGAVVETCAYIIGPNAEDSALFYDARSVHRESLPQLACTQLSYVELPLSSLRLLPSQELLYTLNADEAHKLGKELRFEPHVGRVTKGLSTGSDQRFARLRWEVPEGDSWQPFAKGGEYSWFSGDIHLVVNRRCSGLEMAAYSSEHDGNIARTRQSSKYYGYAAATYSRRSQKGFSARRLRAGAVFSDKSPVIVPQTSEFGRLAWIAPILASMEYLNLIKAQAKFGSFETGAVKRLPVPPACVQERVDAWSRAYRLRDQVDSHDETSGLFLVPQRHSWTVQTAIAEVLDVVAGGLGACGFHLHPEVRALEANQAAKRGRTLRFSATWLSYAVGVALGRFDVRLATGDCPLPELPDPFDPLPACAPGMLPDGKVPDDYPLRVDEDGILVDDEGHPDDIVARVREVFHLVWKDRAEAIEREACEFLKVKSLRDYFRKTGAGGFWSEHVKRYSKSRRKAPIYWLLQSKNGNYSVWLYLHKLDQDTLHKVLGPRYLESKLRRVRSEISALRPDGEHKKEGITKKEEKRLEELEEMEGELMEFERRIQLVAHATNQRGTVVGWKPNLDDGVVLNAAPLHELIPWPATKKHKGRTMSELELYWRELADGKYEWAHIAMHYWPDRVTEACQTDRSTAIAHDLDRVFFPGLREELQRRAEAAESDEQAGSEGDEDDEADGDDGDGDDEG